MVAEPELLLGLSKQVLEFWVAQIGDGYDVSGSVSTNIDRKVSFRHVGWKAITIVDVLVLLLSAEAGAAF